MPVSRAGSMGIPSASDIAPRPWSSHSCSASLSASATLELATLGSARALGLDDEIGSLAAGKRADLTVVSLAGSPFLPWEDPITAVVFGGSPDRVLLTLADGEARYEKGGFEWPELRRSASAARARLLSEAPRAPKT